jgi:hypothetical protein
MPVLSKKELISINPEKEEIISMWVGFKNILYVKEDSILVNMSEGDLAVSPYGEGEA